MESVVGIAAAAAILLVVAGAQKVVDPWPASTALRQAGLWSSRRLVRTGATLEVVLGAGFLVVGTFALAMAIAVVYIGFAGFVVVAMRKGVDGSCGCFGRDDTPPSWLHIVANGGLAVAAILYAVGDASPPLDQMNFASWTAAALAGATAILTVVLIAWYSVAPRTLAATRPRPV